MEDLLSYLMEVIVLISLGYLKYIDSKRERERKDLELRTKAKEEEFMKASKRLEEKSKATEKLTLSLSKAYLSSLSLNYIERGYIYDHELDIILETFAHYKAAGGNGGLSLIIDKLEELEVRKPE